MSKIIQYKKSFIASSLLLLLFLLLRYSPLQDYLLLPARSFNDTEKSSIQGIHIPNLTEKTIKSIAIDAHNGCRSFIIHEDGKPNIQGYIWRCKKSLSLEKGGKSLSRSKRVVILYFKGNGELFSNQWIQWKFPFLRLHYDVVEMDYPGTGGSDGQVRSEKDFTTFAKRCYEYIIAQGYESVIIRGFSLGCFCASYVAAQYRDDPRITMLMLDGGFTALHNARGRYLAPFLWLILRYKLNNIRNLAKVKCPILIRHGRKDRIVSHINGYRLYRSIENRSNTFFILHNGYHNPCSKKEYDALDLELLNITLKKFSGKGDIHKTKKKS